jgi:MYXO-CTERM domain-containing protein
VVDSGPSYGLDQTFLVPFRVPATPVLTLPVNGSTSVVRRPRIEGTAEPGVLVHLFLDGVAYVKVVPAANGVFSYTPSADLAGGAHELRASAEVFGTYSLLSEPTRFDVVKPAEDGGVLDGGSKEDGGLPDDGGSNGGSDGGFDAGSDAGLPGNEPVLVDPAEGEVVDPQPLFAGTSRTGTSVGIEVDGAEVARVPLDKQRRFRYTLTAEQRLAPGAHSATARAWDEAGKAGLSSPATQFEVKAPAALEVGCGCGASPGAGLGLAALLMGLMAARLRRRE